MRFERVNGLVLHCADEGPRQSTALVFANSLGTDLRVWGPLLAVLDGRFRTVRYDLRGHGLSGAPPAPYAIDDHVDDLAALLDALAVERAVVVGLSVGGMVAQGLAARDPARVRGLVLCDTAHRIGTAAMWNERIAAIEAGGIESLADAILERWFSPAFRADRPVELAGWRHMLVRTPLAGYLGTCASLRDADLAAAARAIRVPTLCVAGTDDGATPPDLVRGLAALIPGARFALVEGAGHLPCVEAPAVLARLVTHFLAENDLG